ncbi:carbamoyltransferase [Pseudophaeobacter arcticus]|jgi:carbamoyltransferase|uniref:carbamoyltransferase family protein n=1 Tax=Pseudophaeobacter arcticus TaxID=385492 RepID=UPI0003FB0DE9|nr:carbamoyltransferase C-terminal domain-containing protein [Pseudophaeobacter arcticus]
MRTFYLGLSTTGHDPSLALVDHAGRVVFAEATERFVKDKRAWGLAPDNLNHLASALHHAGVGPDDKINVATTWSSSKEATGTKVHDALLPASDTLWMLHMQASLQQSAGASLLRLGYATEKPQVQRFDHHLCHAVTACSFAPVSDAACLVIDGEGDVGAVSSFTLRDRTLKRAWRSWGPGSLGTFYGWLTGLCGFDWRKGEEWKVMGLAAFGEVDPDLVETLSQLLTVDRGRLRFADSKQTAQIQKVMVQHTRKPGSPILQAANLAATGQACFAKFADQILASAENDTTGNLILSGGCALNSSYNGTIVDRTGFDQVFVPPCPADDGNAIGAALLAWMYDTNTAEIPFNGGSPFLGSSASPKTLAACRAAAAQGLNVTELNGQSAGIVAAELAKGHVLGVMRGQSEFGPRALGNRSILADPRSPEMKDQINARVKGREAYRPFAPVVFESELANWFEQPQPSPYMAKTLPFKKQVTDRIPAVVHEDGTGRVQSVTPTMYPWMSDVLQTFGRLTDVPVLLNTSFNIMGKPIVHDVEDAIGALMTTGLDGVVFDEFLIGKKNICPPS